MSDKARIKELEEENERLRDEIARFLRDMGVTGKYLHHPAARRLRDVIAPSASGVAI
jgi:hypothetical protein